MGKLRMVEPLDIVLFNGNDTVGNFISMVEAKHVVPGLKMPFGALWTHSGIIVDKTVLPLPCLEDGRLYIYESVFSGEVLGYVYSKVLPVDHQVKPKGFHLGPQLRDFVHVVEEGPVDIAICKLDPNERKRLMDDWPLTQTILLSFYSKYEKYGYPLNPLPQFAAASPVLFNTLVGMRNAFDKLYSGSSNRSVDGSSPDQQKVFCSELVALLCRDLGLNDFAAGHITPPEFTPLELNAMPSFRTWFYVRIKDVCFLVPPDGRQVNPVTNEFFAAAFPGLNAPESPRWKAVEPGKLPFIPVAPGYDEQFQPLFVSRVRLGTCVMLGMTDTQGIGKFSFHGNKVRVEYAHEILADMTDLVWVPAKKGKTPPGAFHGGCDDHGNPIFVARAKFVDDALLKVGNRKPPRLLLGGACPEYGGAKFAAHGKEYLMKEDYEVLVHEACTEQAFFNDPTLANTNDKRGSSACCVESSKLSMLHIREVSSTNSTNSVASNDPVDTAFRDAISTVLGASLPLGLHNLYICVYQAIVRKSWLNSIQVVASFFQLINQVCFIILFTQPADAFFHNQCTWFINLADAFFYTYQVLSVTVLMIRTTGLYNKKSVRFILRGIFGTILVVAIAFIFYGTLRRVDIVIANRCAGEYYRLFNLIGKVILFCLYLFLLIAFCIPVLKLIAKTKFETTTKLLVEIVVGVSFRIFLAILGFLITVILSFAGVWGDYFFIEFTVQNYCGITSSTFETTAKKEDNSWSQGRSVSEEHITGNRLRNKDSSVHSEFATKPEHQSLSMPPVYDSAPKAISSRSVHRISTAPSGSTSSSAGAAEYQMHTLPK
ncbi:hypothetical protein HDU97_007563 [Phlyctochytrium planicorne]|nr:hypothetical protein HDU97_007563 [Phlyctochytrium planicorne]